MGPIRTRRTDFRDPDLGRRVESRPWLHRLRWIPWLCRSLRRHSAPWLQWVPLLPAPRVIGGRLRRECPGHLLIYSEQHLRQILTEYAQHYNETSTSPIAGIATSAARARSAHRCDRPDQMQASRPGPDQRVLESSMTSRENTRPEMVCEFWHGTRGPCCAPPAHAAGTTGWEGPAAVNLRGHTLAAAP
jgi:hypothetical protein